MAVDPSVAANSWDADVALADGGTVHVRLINPGDRAHLAEFHDSLSDKTRYLRFFAPYPHLSERDLDRFTTVDGVDRVALVATLADEIVAVGRYERIDDVEAELAFTVRDDHQGRGIGSVLLEHLTAIGRLRGVQRFVADVIPVNRAMIATFVNAGYVADQEVHDGIVRLTFASAATNRSEAVRITREHIAEARSVLLLLHPGSVAVVGVSRTESGVGADLLRNIRAGGFTGALFAVNREVATPTRLCGEQTYATLGDIDGGVDLVVVAVPAPDSLAVVTAAAAAGARGVVVVSTGFAELDATGARLQRDLAALARGAGIRVIGPNSLGILNADPGVRLNASLVRRLPRRGVLGMYAQSASMGAALLERADRRDVGVSSFVSSGNRADVSGNDVMQYWRDDPDTSIAALYLETIGNPRKFTRIARELAATTPVIAIRSTRATQLRPLGHRIPRTSLPAAAIEAVFDQSGVIGASSLYELFDIALLLEHQPLPAGAAVAIVSDSDAHATLAVNALESNGLRLAGWPVIAEEPAERGRLEYEAGLAAAVEDPTVDTVLAIRAPGSAPAADLIAQAAARGLKPVVAALVARASVHQRLHGDHVVVPTFETVEEALTAVAAVARYSQWLTTAAEPVTELDDLGAREIRSAVTRVAAVGSGWVTTTGGASYLRDMLAACGVPVVRAAPASSARDAVTVARSLGYPVALSARGPALGRRGARTAVRLDLAGDSAVRAAWRSLTAELGPESRRERWLQPVVERGLECHVETVEDPLFGPVLGLTVGGAVPLALGDAQFRIPPLRPHDITALLSAPRVGPLLRHIGSEARGGLIDLLVRMGWIADAAPELAELAVGPVLLGPSGVTILRARARIDPRPAGRTDPPARRLP